MTVGTAIGIAVGCTALLAFAGRILWALHKILSAHERQTDKVGNLEEKVDALATTLSNGIRAEIRQAVEHAQEARFLAGQAATRASIAQQKAEEGRSEIERAVNALRAEVNAMTNVALTDHENIWQTLIEAGFDRRSHDG